MPRKALALISGGLDSMLAARVIQTQGLQVEGVNFFTGFCVEGHTQALRNPCVVPPKRHNALWVAEQLGMPLHLINIMEDYKQVVLNPKHGYGANLNPCLDCKIMMVNKALAWLKAHDFDFLISGEVIGQRPMSQRRDTLATVTRASGAGDLLLRPLCAKHLEPTLPERAGWVDRERLYDFNGRGRKPQMALAKSFGFTEYAQPAGGCCFLTDVKYAAKLADLWRHRGQRDYELDDILLLKVGRHLRPAPHFKLIIARDESEGRFLQGYQHAFPHVIPLSHPGPFTLVDGMPTAEDWPLIASLVARFSQGRDASAVEVEWSICNGTTQRLTVAPFLATAIPQAWYP